MCVCARACVCEFAFARIYVRMRVSVLCVCVYMCCVCIEHSLLRVSGRFGLCLNAFCLFVPLSECAPYTDLKPQDCTHAVTRRKKA